MRGVGLKGFEEDFLDGLHGFDASDLQMHDGPRNRELRFVAQHSRIDEYALIDKTFTLVEAAVVHKRRAHFNYMAGKIGYRFMCAANTIIRGHFKKPRTHSASDR